jgi:hypothetical protein
VRIVVLSQATTRCIDLTGRDASERHDFGFPIKIEPPVQADTPHRDFPIGEREHAEAVKFVFRAVDDALDAMQQHDARPIVLLGAERDLAYFDEVRGPRANVVARVEGDYERHTADAIAELMQPVLAAYNLEQQERACAEVRDAIGSHAVAGIREVWAAARAGRGHLLLVEDEFGFSARVAADALQPAPADEPGTFDAVEDTVEEVVRHGGDVFTARGDSLADVGRIALVTRY